MAGLHALLLAALLAADPTASPSEDDASVAEEPKGGAGIAPVELIPRLELRQSFARLESGASLHVTTAQIDIGFFGRVLLRYEGPLRVVTSPAGQISGFGDAEVTVVGVLGSDPRTVAAVIGGAVLDTASQPELGAGKQQVVLGGAIAFKPVRWWLPYVILREQASVAGDAARPDVNVLVGRVGNIIFGKGYSWFKLDLDTVVDFEGEAGRFFGMLEVGSLLIGKTGLFMRSGTQLLGARQVDYSLEVGVRYLFRLEKGR
jgi:hypothetical protein